MQSLEAAVADHDARRGGGRHTAIVVTTALDGYIVVAVVELDVLDQHILRILGVDAVVIDQLGIVAQAVADDVLRLEEVDAPEGGVGDKDTLQRDVLALVELNEMGTEVVSLAEDALLDGGLLMVVLAAQILARTLQRTPGGEGRGSIAVDRTAPHNRNILQPTAIDEGAVIIEECTLPARSHHGEVAARLGVELQGCPLLQLEADTAHKVNRATEPIGPCRDNDAGSAQLLGALHRPIEGGFGVGLAIADSAKIQNREHLGRLLGSGDSCQHGIAHRLAVERCGGLLRAGRKPYEEGCKEKKSFHLVLPVYGRLARGE